MTNRRRKSPRNSTAPSDSPTSANAARTDATRERLLASALQAFGHDGIDGASTRAIAEAAGANLQAINYYFGSKQGLYDATADYIIELVQMEIGPLRQAIRSRLALIEAEGRRPSREEATMALRQIAAALLRLFSSEISSPWASFMLREQARPTAAFTRIYEGVMQPMLRVANRFVAVLIGADDPDSEIVRLRTLSLLGSLLVFRIARAMLMAEMGWTALGKQEVDVITGLADDLVAGLAAREGSRT